MSNVQDMRSYHIQRSEHQDLFDSKDLRYTADGNFKFVGQEEIAEEAPPMALPVPEPGAVDNSSSVLGVAGDVGTGVGKGVVSGALEAGRHIGDTFTGGFWSSHVAPWMRENIPGLKEANVGLHEALKPEGGVQEVTKSIAEPVTQVVAPGSLFTKVFRTAGIGSRYLAEALGYGAADVAAVDPTDTTILEMGIQLIDENSPIRETLEASLGAQEDDNAFVERLKNLPRRFLEGGPMGLVFERSIEGLGVAYRAIKSSPKYKETLIKKGEEAEARLSTLGSTLSANPIGPTGDVIVSGVGKVADKIKQRRIGTTGQYVGAPKGIDSPQKLNALRKNMLKLAKAGEEGRFWYERSGNAIVDLVDGNIDEADKIAQAIAITSAGSTPVLSNFQFAMQAYNQHKAGKEILTGKFPKAMSARLKKLFDGEDWEGRKTNTFYNNIMAVANPNKAQGVTVDMHMLRIFGFGKKNEMPTDQQYTFVENEVTKIAEKLGWTPYQVQAAMWVKQKSDTAGKPVSEMKFDYSDALKKNLGQISWETKPSKASGHFPELFNAELKQQADFHFRISKALTDDNGKDLLAKEVGLLTPGSFDAPGIYEGVLSPGTQTYALMPMKYKGQPGEVDEGTLDLVKVYSVSRGILLKQDSVGAHRTFYKKGKAADRDAVAVRIGRKFTNDEMVDLDKLLTEEFGTTDFSPAATEYGVNIVHWMGERGKMDFTDFQKKVKKVLSMLEISDINTPSGKLEAGTAATQKLYVTNTDFNTNTGWNEATNGENYLEGTFGGRPDLQNRVRSIVTKFADRIEAVEDEIVREYGWTRNESLNTEYKQVNPEATPPQLEGVDDGN